MRKTKEHMETNCDQGPEEIGVSGRDEQGRLRIARPAPAFSENREGK